MQALLLAMVLQQSPFDPEREQIRLWILALESEEGQRRDAAMAKLSEFGVVAYPQLRENLRHPDLEVRERCRTLLRGPAFQTGARQLAGVGVVVPDVRPDQERKELYETLATTGKLHLVLREDHAWITTIIDGILSDRRDVAQASLRAMHLVIQRRSLERFGACAERILDLKALESAELRASEYGIWAQWWFTMAARRAVAAWSEEKPNPARVDWEDLIKRLGVPGRIDDPSGDEYQEVEWIRTMGDGAFPFIVWYLDHEDVTIGKSALELLKRITGREERPLTEANKYDLRAEWLAWIRDNR